MGCLTDPRQEAFAEARAKGMTQKAAYAQAGYKSTNSGASMLAARPPVAARIAELKLRNDAVRRARTAETILDLITIADACVGLKSAAAMKEARIARLEANRLRTQLPKDEPRAPLPPLLTTEEWIRQLPPPHNMQPYPPPPRTTPPP